MKLEEGGVEALGHVDGKRGFHGEKKKRKKQRMLVKHMRWTRQKENSGLRKTRHN